MIRRRAFLAAGGSALIAAPKPVLRVGLVTDTHYADKPPAGTRFYRESLGKMREAVRRFRDERIDFAVELGDFIDAAPDAATEQQWLRTISQEFAACSPRRHFVLGNHCVQTLAKEEFLAACGASSAHYSFDRKGWHFVILDACYRADATPYRKGNFEWTDSQVPEAQRQWLAADLARAKGDTVVLVHQRLDVGGSYGVKSAEAVREILERSGKVALVLQGHSHKNDLKEINGIPYCTLAAMIEGSGETNSGYAVMELSADGAISIRGFRNQASREFTPTRRSSP